MNIIQNIALKNWLHILGTILYHNKRFNVRLDLLTPRFHNFYTCGGWALVIPIIFVMNVNFSVLIFKENLPFTTN